MERWQIRAPLITALVTILGLLLAAIKAKGTGHALLVWILLALGIAVFIGLIVSFWPRPKAVKSEPRLIFRNAIVEPRLLGLSNWSIPVTGFGGREHEEWLRLRPDLESEAWCVYAWVENVPVVGDDGESPDAKNVHATLKFIDRRDHIIAEMPGRWAEREQDAVVERTQAPATMDLPANVPRKLDVAIKYSNDPQCYAWNDESRFKTPDLKDVGLGDYPVTVEIRLQGSGVTASATYLLNHSGLDVDPPTIVRVN